MKKYFAKYLPVEGDIKERDTIYETDLKTYNKASKDYTDNNLDQKVKLFLCTRDIQVGDKDCVIYNSDGSFTQHMECKIIREDNYAGFIRPTWEQVNFFLKDCFKVIGEISPEAIWVKEGDEFNEGDINIIDCGGHVECCESDQCKFKHKGGNFIEIKCSQCNTFY